MTEYTPTTEEIRNRFTFYASGVPHPEFEEQFDRWLASVKAEVWEQGFFDGVDHALWKIKFDKNPYREETE